MKMKPFLWATVLGLAALGISADGGSAIHIGRAGQLGPHGCPPDSVLVGTTCIDKYESSVWDLTGVSPAVKPTLVKKIKSGTVTLADLTAAGAIQRGLVFGDLAAAGCANTGNDCLDFYAVSIAGVKPLIFISNRKIPSCPWNVGINSDQPSEVCPAAEFDGCRTR